jgi:hypothetical protein
VRAALRKLIIPLPLKPDGPNNLPLDALTQDNDPLSTDPLHSSWKQCSASIESVIMVDSRRALRLKLGPELEPDFTTLAFMPIFPFGIGCWIVHVVHPPNSRYLSTSMVAPQPRKFISYRGRQSGFQNPRTYTKISWHFYCCFTPPRVKFCCRILENIRSDESIEDRFEGKLSRYLKNTTDRDDNIQWLDCDETEEGVNKELAVNHGLSPRHHQVVAEDQNENCKVRVSLSLQNVRNEQLVAPVEITFYDSLNHY